MRKVRVFISVVLLMSGVGSYGEIHRSTTPSLQSPPPNILLIISDDQGYSDFGFMDNPILRTPRIDRLAQSGAVFRNYVTGPACSPGRSMLFTGRNDLLTGVWGVPPRQNLRPDETMMPAFFKAAGYETYYLGKTDCVAQHHTLPWFAGWDDAFCVGGYVHHDAVMQRKPAGDKPITWSNKKYEGWTAERLTDDAIRFIKEKKDEPWLLSMAYIIPHTPWKPADERYAPYYREKSCSESIASCYSHIEQMDACVGRLLDTLRETGQDRRTLVLYVSDNGQTGPDQHTVDTEGYIRTEDWAMRNVANLRGSKSLVWGNGILVPLIVSMPGTIPAGDREQFGAVEDVLPTLLDYAGIPNDIVPHKPFCGVSLRPALDDKDTVFDHPEMFRMTIWGHGMVTAPAGYVPDPASLKFEDHHTALRGARYKLHARPGGKVELYDIVDDMGETKEISANHPEVTERMLTECRRRWDHAITDGKAFRMAKIVVGDPATWKYGDGTFWGYAAKVQKSTGNLRVGAGAVLIGFESAGDSASYDLDVVKAGDYSISLLGKDLENGAPLSIKVVGQTLTVQKVTETTMEFGTAQLPIGEMKLEIIAGNADGKTKPVSIERILFFLEK